MLVAASSNLPALYSFHSQSGAAPGDKSSVKTANPAQAGGIQLTEEQQRQVDNLKARDREVRNHEQAHLSAAGNLAVSGAQFSYVTGPDGQRYASGGEVGIDVSEVAGDPEATLRKAEIIRRAALAPTNPSSPDQSIAAKAAAMANKARAELLNLQKEPSRNGRLIDLTA
ncbi:putative metalloprotease CJM1_0395 family protein [Methylomonas sp. 2BW1-5-20]|uniref:putative metalloprotease CJM1_0395 family protein n=1 Tax=Methylomonas sp. 2BW1-5-20 TaxID=3376686 RepID=UPI004050B497